MPSHNYSLNLLSLIKLYQVQLVVDPEISERGLGYLQVHVGGLGKHNKLGGGGGVSPALDPPLGKNTCFRIFCSEDKCMDTVGFTR